MDKNTILAIVLSALVITLGMFFTQLLNQKYAPPAVLESRSVNDNSSDNSFQEESIADTAEISSQSVPESPAEAEQSSELPEQNYPARKIVETTDVYNVIFNTEGGVVSEIELINELDDGRPISMVLDGDTDTGTFNLALGSVESEYIKDVFDHERIQDGQQIIHSFSRLYSVSGKVFKIVKKYRIVPDEYLIDLTIVMESLDGRALPKTGSGKDAYTLTYGPQIGPEFKDLDGRYEVRDFVSWGPDPRNGKMKRATHKSRNNLVQISNTIVWGGVVGKYFAVIMAPGSGESTITWDNRPVEGQTQPSRMQISRPLRRQSIIEDRYYFFIGPLDNKQLSLYNKPTDNAFGLSGMNFGNAPRSSSMLGWLQTLLRLCLEMFYKLIPNYGIAIILLTILVKILLYPLTRKSYESTGKMQALQPKIKEMQEKYKGDQRKLNEKMAGLYKAEGVNPMGGCLPMLLQLPIFLALYGLLNRYFPLRGATFIPGWITDLSAPDYIGKEFANPINLLIIEIPAIRILPVLYLGGQLLLSKITQQAAAGQSGMQQKMFTVVMPIMFFFILYNMPSGLLLYWSVMNFITIGQQYVANFLKKSKTAGG